MSICSGSHVIIFFLSLSYGQSQKNSLYNESHVILRDNFNGSLLNNSLWNTANASNKDEADGVWHYYSPKNVLVQNNSLHLKACRSHDTTKNYTSGRVDTAGSFSFKYGEIEWKARIVKGQGLWSGLWLQHFQCRVGIPCQDWPPSISMIDVRGQRPNEIDTTVFWKEPHSEKPCWVQTHVPCKDMSLEYHLYRLLWLPSKIVWFIDNKEVFRVTDREKIPSVPMQLVMVVNVGGKFPMNPDNSTQFPAYFLIDYVVVRQTGNESETLLPWAILAIVLCIIIVCAISGLGIFYFVQRRKRLPIKTDWGYYHVSPCYKKNIDPCFHFLEIPIGHLQKTSELIGKGHFGCVWKGLLKNGTKFEDKQVVAVKTFLECAEEDEVLQRELFLAEMKVMTKVGRHLNIVNLLGTVTSGKPILMVLEFCPHGSLLEYLQKERDGFINCVDANGRFLGTKTADPGLTEVIYLNQEFILTARARRFRLSTKDLIHITYQISRGLEYLAVQSIIHRDLAARNILVCEDNIVKISDFGLAKERILSDYIMQNDQIALPVKWMAPESITERTFSYKSDVWSFGILAWEIFSLGEAPFSAKDGSGFIGNIRDFARAISRGLTMSRPLYAPDFIYTIMLSCWRIEKDARPSASCLQKELSGHLAEGQLSRYLQLDEPYQDFNTLYADLLDVPSTTRPSSTDLSSSEKAPNL